MSTPCRLPAMFCAICSVSFVAFLTATNRPKDAFDRMILWRELNRENLIYWRIDFLMTFLKMNADVKHSRDLITPIDVALLRSDARLLKILIEHGADVNHITQNFPPLHRILLNRNELDQTILSTLLSSQQIRINFAAGPAGWMLSPIQIAARYHGAETVLKLLQHGANIHHIDSSNGQT